MRELAHHRRTDEDGDMLGWHISVYRKTADRTTPATIDADAGPRLAVWQGGIGALKWLDDLVGDSDALNLGGNGYPFRYTATSEHIVPVMLGGPPDAIERWRRDAGDVIDPKWAGRTVLDVSAIDACQPGEWLLIEAWDES